MNFTERANKFVNEVKEWYRNPERRKAILDVIHEADDDQLQSICNGLSLFFECEDQILELLTESYDEDEDDLYELFSETLEVEYDGALQALDALVYGHLRPLMGDDPYPFSYTQALYDQLRVLHPDQTGVQRAVDLIEGYAAHHDLYAASELL